MHSRSKRLSSPTYWLSVVAVGLLVGFSIQFARAWVDPVSAPPGGNVAGPLTTGPQTQMKTGQLNITGGGAFGKGGIVIGQHSLNSNSDAWLSLGDSTNNILTSAPLTGFTANYLSAYGAIYSQNWTQFQSGTVRYAAGFYGPGWAANSEPQKEAGSIYVNDIWLRSVNKWASGLSTPVLGRNNCYWTGPYADSGDVGRPSYGSQGDLGCKQSCNAGEYVAAVEMGQWVGCGSSTVSPIVYCCRP